MRILGVDPGASGALAVLDTRDGALELYDMPTIIEKVRGEKRTRVDHTALGRLLWAIDQRGMVSVAIVEKVGARPQQGVASTFAFGAAYGIVLGALGSLGIDVHQRRPQEWQRTVKLRTGEDVKDHSRAKAADVFPRYADQFKRKKDNGRSDAALIAYSFAVENNLTWPTP